MNITNIKGKEKVIDNTKTRLQSLDALRGFDMFWIISAEVIIHGLAKATNLPFFNWMSGQLNHTPWNGFTFYDMIFLLFIFISGVSMPFSFGSQLEKNHFNKLLVKKKIYRSLIKRTIILILLGMIVNRAQNFNDYEMVKVVMLDKKNRLQQVDSNDAVYFNKTEEVPTHAITLTVPALFNADYAFVIVPGKKSCGCFSYAI